MFICKLQIVENLIRGISKSRYATKTNVCRNVCIDNNTTNVAFVAEVISFYVNSLDDCNGGANF